MTDHPKTLVLATRNQHKLAELRRILSEEGLGGLQILSLQDFPAAPDVVETGITFVQNAMLKAQSVAVATGLPAVADDSGLCVDVLGGAPGVFSARWCGRHGDDLANLELLLAQLADVPGEHRTAYFACAAVLATPEGAERIAEGRLVGNLIHAPRGSNGFGYDPIFVPDGESCTTAEMSAADKDAISHRGRAFRALAEEIRTLLGA